MLVERRRTIIEKMRNNPRDWRFEQVENLLKFFGFETRKRPTPGSHVVFTHKKLGLIIPIPFARPIKPIYIKKVVSILDKVLEKGDGNGTE